MGARTYSARSVPMAKRSRPGEPGRPAGVRAGVMVLSDDVRNLAEARQRGLTWGFLTAPIGEHFTPGHRLLDWIVAVPLGLHWAAAVTLMLVFSGVMLAYLAGALTLLFGPGRRNAIPVLLAGTAWPLMGAAQWFAGGALAIPVSAAIAGAIYHHLRWRSRGAGRDRAASAAWTIVGLLFSQQAILILAILVVCALVATRVRVGLGSLIREVGAVLPLLVPTLALHLRRHTTVGRKRLVTVGDELHRVGSGYRRPRTTSRSGGHRNGRGITRPQPRSVHARTRDGRNRGRADLGCLAGMALVRGARAGGLRRGAHRRADRRRAPQRRRDDGRVRAALPVACRDARRAGNWGAANQAAGPRPAFVPAGSHLAPRSLGIGWLGLYAANLSYTYKTRRVYLDFARASHESATRLERGLRTALAAGRADAIVDGPLPYPLFYVQPSGNLRSAYSKFFVKGGITAPGIPEHGNLLSIASDGELSPVAVRPIGPAVRCVEARPCQVPGRGAPAEAGELVLTVQPARTRAG